MNQFEHAYRGSPFFRQKMTVQTGELVLVVVSISLVEQSCLG